MILKKKWKDFWWELPTVSADLNSNQKTCCEGQEFTRKYWNSGLIIIISNKITEYSLLQTIREINCGDKHENVNI